MLEVVEQELVPGLVVSGKYRLDRPIGRGGFGVVWSAVDVTTGEPRALKCLTSEGATDGKRQERLRREAHAMTSITHPHIARVFGLEELPAGTPFIVMELVQGRTLHAQLSRGPLSIAQARGILIQIADALRTVHARGVIHRDLKPANVMIVDDRIAKVLDFGIAKDLSSSEKHKLTTTGTALGTLFYMAPEQIFGERNLDGRCDVWALGIVAHECLTLRRPTDADGDNSGQVLKAILDGNFPRLSTLVRDCPADLDDLVARMLMRDVSQRPTSEEVFATLVQPAMSPTKPHSLGRTNHMLETLPLSDAPMFALTMRDENFAGSQLVPSTVVPSTVVPSTVLQSRAPGTEVPSTRVPSTQIPSTQMPSTLVAAQSPVAARPITGNAPTMGSAQIPAPAITPAHARAAEAPTFQTPREAAPQSRGLAVPIAIFAGLAVIGLAIVAVANVRGHRADAPAPSASHAVVQVAPPPPAASSMPVAPNVAAPASSVSVAASASASASAPPMASASVSARPFGPTVRTGATPAKTSAPAKPGDRPPEISDHRF